MMLGTSVYYILIVLNNYGTCTFSFPLTEVVTQIAFSQDCKYLYTVSGDSCVFVWRLSREITQVHIGCTDSVAYCVDSREMHVHCTPWQITKIMSKSGDVGKHQHVKIALVISRIGVYVHVHV